MAITERERERVQAFFEKAQEEGRLTPLDVTDIDVLYPYSQWPCVLRIVKEKTIELWACELDEELKIIGAIQVGTQDEFGRNHWVL